MQSIGTLFNLPTTPKVTFKNWRDEMISEAVEHINLLRKGTKFENKIETKEKLARRINMNPKLAGSKNDGELNLVLKNCKAKNNYSHLYWLISQKR